MSCSLKTHIRTHAGDKTYTCYLGFSQNHNLQKHTRIHTGDKP